MDAEGGLLSPLPLYATVNNPSPALSKKNSVNLESMQTLRGHLRRKKKCLTETDKHNDIEERYRKREYCMQEREKKKERQGMRGIECFFYLIFYS